MKTMKLFSMAAAALLMAACSNSDDFDVQKPAETAGVYHFEATIAAPDADASMRTVYTEVTESSDPDFKKIKVAWKVGDQIALVHNKVVDVAEVTAVDASGNATIEADISGSPSNDELVYLAYPADAVVSATPYDPFPFTPNPDIFDIVKEQDGTLKYIQDNLDLRMGGGLLAVSGSDVSLKGSVSIPSLICIWKLTLQDESSNALSATQLTFVNNKFTQAKATSAAKSEYYLCVVPSFIPDPLGTFSFVAKVGSDTYTFSTTSLSLTEGMYYQSTVKMAKNVPTVDLSTISGNSYTVTGDVTLTGTPTESEFEIKYGGDDYEVTLDNVNSAGSKQVSVAGNNHNINIKLKGTSRLKEIFTHTGTKTVTIGEAAAGGTLILTGSTDPIRGKTLTINGGTVKSQATTGGNWAVYLNNTGGVLTINGGALYLAAGQDGTQAVKGTVSGTLYGWDGSAWVTYTNQRYATTDNTSGAPTTWTW